MCGGAAERIHLFRILEQPKSLSEFQILCIPGGFSYGDDIGAGVIFASQLRGHLRDVIAEFLQADKLILGICNGFQVLLKSGILPDGAEGFSSAVTQSDSAPDATLTWNDNGKYTARWVHLRAPENSNVFLRGITELDLPIAHGEGKIVVRDPAVLERWVERKQIGLCYAGCCGEVACPTEGTGAVEISSTPLPFPANPNGSVANIAALGDPTGRVLGLMPHPERFIFGTQHPHWTRRQLPEEGAGLQLFRNAVEYFA